MLQITLHSFDRERLERDGRCSHCLPILPSTVTVLGYRVTSKSEFWRELTWKYVAIDGSFDPKWQYLHVGLADDRRYRVRCLLEIGDLVRVRRAEELLRVDAVTVAGMWDGRWWWRLELSRASQDSRTQAGPISANISSMLKRKLHQSSNSTCASPASTSHRAVTTSPLQ